MKNIYKLTVYNSIIRESDNTYIPIDLDNSDYQVYLSWVEEGNTADPIPAPTIEEQQALNIVAIQFYMDNKAKSRGYFDIKSACAYASTISIVASNDPNYSLCEKFRLEGNALQTWRSEGVV